MPKRIQRRHTKGWRMPAGARYVGRGTKWGNPYRVGKVHDLLTGRLATPAQVVGLYRHYLINEGPPALVAMVRAELAGRDLACWCALDVPCHVDVLLEVANGGAS